MGDLAASQRRFAAHLRHPQQHPAPAGIEARRLKIYQDLIYNNIEGFIRNTFPVCRQLFPDGRWHAMVRDFVHRHASQSPYFLDISQEFLRYLQEERQQAQGSDEDPPFFLELAHYEWVELALDVAELPTLPALDPGGDLLHGVPVISPVAWALSYQYPVHEIGPAYQPTTPPAAPTCLLVFRDAEEQVRFQQTNPATLRLLQLLTADQGLTGAAAIAALAQELNHPDPAALHQFGAELLAQWRAQGVVLGALAS